MIQNTFYPSWKRTVWTILCLFLPIGGYAQETSGQSQDKNLVQKIGEGEFVFNGKLRYWYAKQANLRTSHAFTFGTNFGYLTKSYKGFRVYVEGESVVALTPDLYFDGINNETDRTNVTDPETLELNKMSVSYTDSINNTFLQIEVGRQAATIEDERFIGNVSARQDDQTFDAATFKIQNKQKGLSLEYAYLYQINRLVAEQADWRSNSHAFSLAYFKNPKARVGLFGHLFDFQMDAPAKSSKTFGITLDRAKLPQDRTALAYKTAFAYQSDYGDNPTAFAAYFVNAEFGISLPRVGTFSLGYELASSDEGRASYQFPLSTGQRLHRISDVFIDPPADGLHNPYFTAEFKNIVWGIGGWLGYHLYYSEEESNLLGQEIDLVLYRSIVPNLLRAELTYSSFFGEDASFQDLNIVALDIVFEL